MSHDIPRTSPQDPSDLDRSLDAVDRWHSQVLAITRQKNPTEIQKHLVRAVNDTSTRTMVRMFGSDFRALRPDSQEFTEAAGSLQTAVYRMAEVSGRGEDQSLEEHKAQQEELMALIREIDVRLPMVTNRNVIRLLEINAAFMAGSESHLPSLRTPVEDGAMAAASMLQDVLRENPNLYAAFANDGKIVGDLGRVDALSQRYEDLTT